MTPPTPRHHPHASPRRRVPSHPTPTLTLQLLPLLFLFSPTANAQCFAPSGAPANDTPCYPDLPDSFCCGAGYTCMSIKACQGPSTPNQGWYARGTCTSPNYSDAACPTFCRDSDYGFLTDIFECPDGKWCCQREDKSGNACCGTSSLLFDLGLATTLGVVGPSGGLYSINTAAQLQAQSTESASAAASTSASSTGSSVSSVASSGSTRSSPVQTAASSNSGSSSSSQTPVASTHNGPSTGTIAGAAVGGVAGFAVILALGIWIFLRQRRKIRSLKGQIAGQRHEGGYRDGAGMDVQGGNGHAGERAGYVNEMYAVPAEIGNGKRDDVRNELDGQGKGAGKRMTRAEGVELG